MTEPVAAVLAIDGGNSKTDVLLVDADGTILASLRGPGASPQAVGLEASMRAFDDMVRRTARDARLPPGKPLARHTAAYLAGADLPREEEMLQRAVAEQGWSHSTVVGNDTFAVLRAGTPDGVGVAVVCGAGINCVGVAPDGQISRFPSVGRISGDWGAGEFLATEMIWWAMRAADGRGPDTALLPAVLDHFRAASAPELVERLHFGEVPPDHLGALTPILFQVAEGSDEVALRLVERLAEEVALLATVSLRRLDLLTEAVPVVLGGGVAVGAGPLLWERVRQLCTTAAPRCEVRVVDVPPVVGAALYGLDAIGAEPAAEQRLRSAGRALLGGIAERMDDPR
ncbi:N-acetylglucosamine kinase [Longimycelium tulufanense]|uniref:N-acetylglucosamine kinase n=1 Tax=Longimycelium tulufanense TaxID=907463 RepID=A0A8J3C968_9PSEU|nr:BadF/BadG/BcrA/BcrD ATPase family protein [Longimycelium tulufanense]GGM44139.1 N-acetylglucosamine kinase [Longimycelium tulufanense]